MAKKKLQAMLGLELIGLMLQDAANTGSVGVKVAHGVATVQVPSFKRAEAKGGAFPGVDASFRLDELVEPDKYEGWIEGIRFRAGFVAKLKAAMDEEDADNKLIAEEFGLVVAVCSLLAYPRGEGKPLTPEERATRAAKKTAKKPATLTAAAKALHKDGISVAVIAGMLRKTASEIQAYVDSTESTLVK